jgi:hypothetical protein
MPITPLLSRRAKRGNTIVEFGLVAVFLVPLFIGTINLGLSLGYNVQVSQIARDAGHMYVRQLDFSLDASKEVVVRMARGMGMTKDDGRGIVILSKVMFIGEDQCALASLAAGDCTNLNEAVVIQRHIIGKSSLWTSTIGTPNAALILTAPDAESGLKAGDIKPADFLTQPSCVSAKMKTLLPGMLGGETAYVVEAYFSTPDWSLKQSYTQTAEGVYARSIF